MAIHTHTQSIGYPIRLDILNFTLFWLGKEPYCLAEISPPICMWCLVLNIFPSKQLGTFEGVRHFDPLYLQ